jgi:hypothetical protein
VPKNVEKEGIDKLVQKLDESRRIISNPSLLNYVMHFLGELLQMQQPLTRFGLLKTVIKNCQGNHK